MGTEIGAWALLTLTWSADCSGLQPGPRRESWGRGGHPSLWGATPCHPLPKDDSESPYLLTARAP